MCDEILNVADSISTNVINTVLTNVTSAVSTNVSSIVSINSDDKIVGHKMGWCFFHTFLLETILLIITVIICYHYAKNKSKQKNIGTLTI